MNISEIRKFPTVLENDFIKNMQGQGCKGIHESVLRSFQILEKVKEWLKRGDIPDDMILELIYLMEEKDETKCNKSKEDDKGDKGVQERG